MSAPQTTVASSMPTIVPGQLADLHTEESGATESRISTETSLSLPWGTLAARDGATGVKLIASSGDAPAGVVIFERTYDYPSERDAFGPLPGLPIELLRGGDNERIGVYTEEAVAVDGTVRVRIATENRAAATPQVQGGFRTTAVSGKTVVLAGCRFVQASSAGGPAVLEITGPITIASAD